MNFGRNQYPELANVGSNMTSMADDPLTYCLNTEMDSSMIHGGIAQTVTAPNSKNCQAYMSEFCAHQWNEFCELASMNDETNVANNLKDSNSRCVYPDITAGEILVRNTAARKYLSKMHNCQLEYEPFDPTVPESPMISTWNGAGQCIPMYEVNPESIDGDPVMNKILAKPAIAFDVLVNIYNTMKRNGTLHKLHGTNLGQFFNTHHFFTARGGMTK